jgi:tetratricopeptide (TPR) repeat protein
VGNAVRVYQRLDGIAAQDQRARTGLARAAALTGDYATAERILNELVDPRHAVYGPSYVALAEVQRAQGKLDEAIASYTHIARLAGFERQGYMALAELYQQKGDYDAALKAAQQAAFHSPPNDSAVQGLIAAIRARR